MITSSSTNHHSLRNYFILHELLERANVSRDCFFRHHERTSHVMTMTWRQLMLTCEDNGPYAPVPKKKPGDRLDSLYVVSPPPTVLYDYRLIKFKHQLPAMS